MIPGYNNLSALYYAYDIPCATEQELAFYRSFMFDGAEVYEPMCGSGNFLLPLLKEGFRITGSDASADMLALLEKKAAALGLKPTVWQQKIQELCAKKTYDIIFIPSGSFGLITEIDEIILSLKLISQALKPGGLFIFEVETPRTLDGIINTWLTNHARISNGIQITRHCLMHDPLDSLVIIDCEYILQEQGRTLATQNEQVTMRLYTKDTMTELLKTAGFCSIQMLKPYETDTLASDDASTIVFVCTT